MHPATRQLLAVMVSSREMESHTFMVSLDRPTLTQVNAELEALTQGIDLAPAPPRPPIEGGAWEHLAALDGPDVRRFAVPGGWLYLVGGLPPVFVPMPPTPIYSTAGGTHGHGRSAQSF